MKPKPPEGPEGPSEGSTDLSTARDAAKTVNRDILRLAVPAFGALVAEPVFVLADSAIVGHLGTPQLAGLSLASTLLLTVVGLFVFLAYATTATVARLTGAGRRAEALSRGIDGLWLALALGLMAAVVGYFAAPWLLQTLGADATTTPYAISYLRWSLPGLPGMLLVLAATGVLRGLQDTKTPLIVAASGAVVNIGLNLLFVVVLGYGIAGSAAGTALTQTLMAITLGFIVVRGARREGAILRPHPGGVMGAARSGVPLFVRSLSLRVAILVTVTVATARGDVVLGAHQVVNSLWGFTAFALDALAIAAQALTGQALGQGDPVTARAITRRTQAWGIWAGVVLGAAILALHSVLPQWFSQDPAVQSATSAALIVIAVAMPIAGWAFILDGILIGAGDGRFLAAAGVVTLAVYLAALGFVWKLAPDGAAGLVWIWIAFAGGFMLARAVANAWRIRGDKWMRLGA